MKCAYCKGSAVFYDGEDDHMHVVVIRSRHTHLCCSCWEGFAKDHGIRSPRTDCPAEVHPRRRSRS